MLTDGRTWYYIRALLLTSVPVVSVLLKALDSAASSSREREQAIQPGSQAGFGEPLLSNQQMLLPGAYA
jgi:hypothetical protein